MAVFVLLPANSDLLLDSVRLNLGDFSKAKYSDSILRAAILGGFRMLQKRWKNRYLVYNDAMLQTPTSDVVVPSGYMYAKVLDTATFVPSGLTADLDVVRSPLQTFSDPGPDVVSQEDEYPLVLAATVIMRRAQLTSSADSLVSWSDGEYSYSNLSSAKNLLEMFNADKADLENYFKRRPAVVLRSNFAPNYPFGYPLMPLLLY